MAPEPKLRVLVAKPGLDGHDRGAKIIARALRDAGMEVIYTGLRSNVEAIVLAAIQEDVDLIGLSMLSGAHKTVGPKIMQLLRERDADIPVIMGGVIPSKDHDLLKSQGIAAIFGQEDTLDHVVGKVKELALAHHRAGRSAN
jgi:methylmalonyl-CoA mutase C-terminal domain/subunit